MKEEIAIKPVLEKSPERTDSPHGSDKALVDNFLDSFDFKTLRELLAHELRKSGGDIRKAHKVDRKNFKPGNRVRMNEKKNWGVHKEGLAEISPAVIEASELDSIDTMIHESLHIVANNRLTYRHNRVAHWLFGSSYMASGIAPALMGATVAQSLVAPLTMGAFFLYLKLWRNQGFRTGRRQLGAALVDEGMTVLMTTELTPVFLEQTGRKGLADTYRTRRVDLNFDEKSKYALTGSYPLGQILMLQFIRAVSRVSGRPGDEVWKGFKKQYLTKGLNREIVRIFDEAFGDGFMNKIRKLDAKETDFSKINSILQQHFDRSITVEIANEVL